MANKSKNNKKNIIIGVCAAVVVVVLIVLAVVFGTKNGGMVGGLNDAFFTSDGSKYVLSLNADEMTFDEEEYAPVKTHLVYFYSGDKITSLKAYYEYADETGAKAAYDYLTSEQQDNYKSISRDGKYVILEANEDEYEGVTVEDVKQQIEFMETLRTMDVDDSTEEDIPESGEVTEGEVVDITEPETVQE